MTLYLKTFFACVGMGFVFGLMFGDQDYCGRMGMALGALITFALFVHRNREWLG